MATDDALASPRRLAALAATGLGPHPDEAFDRFARMVRSQLGVPVSLVSLVDDARQFFPGAQGLPDPWAGRRETPLSHSFCQHVVLSGEPLVVEDAPSDDLVCTNLAIPDLGVVAYAGVPLTDASGQVLGSLCAIDAEPRRWKADELDTLRDLAAACSSELRLRIEAERARAAQTAAEASQARLAVLAEVSRSLVGASGAADGLDTLVSLVSPWMADGCAVTLLDDDAASVRLVVSAGLLPAALADLTGTDVGAVPRPWRDVLRGVTSDGRWEGRLDGTAGHALVLPLGVHGRVLGTLTAARTDARSTFSPDDTALLRDLASRAGLALENVRLYERQQRAAEVLQRSLLSAVPPLPGLDVVARYLPAAASAQVGGDWYDVVVQPDGETVLVIGDVMGHDMGAAAAMGQLRSLLRGVVYDRAERPSAVLTRVDRAVQGLGVTTMASALVARLEQAADEQPGGRRRLRWSSAGHLPPLLVPADGPVVTLPSAGDLVLGLDPGLERTDAEVPLAAGATLLLFTDGLVERRDSQLDVGLDRLRRVLGDLRGQPLEASCDTLLERMLPAQPEDDVALLAVRVLPEE